MFLVDVVQFFSGRWKFIGLITLILTAITIALSLLMPKQTIPEAANLINQPSSHLRVPYLWP